MKRFFTALSNAQRMRRHLVSTTRGGNARKALNDYVLRTLYEDRHVIVVDKPSGLLSQPDRTGDPCVRDVLINRGLRFVSPVHRLDRVVTGCMILAKSSKAARRLSNAFHDRTVDKYYAAVVSATLPPRNGYERSIVQTSDDKTAILEWQAMGPVSNDQTLLDVRLITGFKHQIRLQLASMGCPIVGDRRYDPNDGTRDRTTTTMTHTSAIALHARRLVLDHPVRGFSAIDVEAPIPWELWRRHLGIDTNEALAQARSHGETHPRDA